MIVPPWDLFVRSLLQEEYPVMSISASSVYGSRWVSVSAMILADFSWAMSLKYWILLLLVFGLSPCILPVIIAFGCSLDWGLSWCSLGSFGFVVQRHVQGNGLPESIIKK